MLENGALLLRTYGYGNMVVAWRCTWNLTTASIYMSPWATPHHSLASNQRSLGERWTLGRHSRIIGPINAYRHNVKFAKLLKTWPPQTTGSCSHSNRFQLATTPSQPAEPHDLFTREMVLPNANSPFC